MDIRELIQRESPYSSSGKGCAYVLYGALMAAGWGFLESRDAKGEDFWTLSLGFLGVYWIVSTALFAICGRRRP